jgi:hypothetical protein
MSEIQSLTLRVQSLIHSVDWWNTAMIWGLALAAIAAVFVVIATRVVVTRTGELSTAQDLLSEAKDRQLREDLKAKDLEIEKLRQQAIPRRLSTEQRNRLSSALSLFRGISVSLMRDNKSSEIWDLGEDIMAALDSRGAGWIVNDGSEPTHLLLGVKVELNKYATDRGVQAALTLAKLLHEDAGLDISPPDISVVNLRGKEPAEENAVQIKITIGKKP